MITSVMEHSMLSCPVDTHNVAMMRSYDTEVNIAPKCKNLKFWIMKKKYFLK